MYNKEVVFSKEYLPEIVISSVLICSRLISYRPSNNTWSILVPFDHLRDRFFMIPFQLPYILSTYIEILPLLLTDRISYLLIPEQTLALSNRTSEIRTTDHTMYPNCAMVKAYARNKNDMQKTEQNNNDKQQRC